MPAAGRVLFGPAGTTLEFSAAAGGPVRIWAAACNGRVFAAVPAVANGAATHAAVPEPQLVGA